MFHGIFISIKKKFLSCVTVSDITVRKRQEWLKEVGTPPPPFILFFLQDFYSKGREESCKKKYNIQAMTASESEWGEEGNRVILGEERATELSWGRRAVKSLALLHELYGFSGKLYSATREASNGYFIK